MEKKLGGVQDKRELELNKTQFIQWWCCVVGDGGYSDWFVVG